MLKWQNNRCLPGVLKLNPHEKETHVGLYIFNNPKEDLAMFKKSLLWNDRSK